jgi:MFS transporter, OFA family, oxalate/formate antiporter
LRLRFINALNGRLPFYYGWVILAVVCAASFSRQGPAVATLSIFIEPMTSEFGWSMTEISGAVSLGGILGAIAAPLIGPFLDRNGARTILCFAVLFTGLPLLCLSSVNALPMFYLFYCVARMNFTGPYDIGIYGSIVNWFYLKRSFATSVTTLALMSGLVAMPLIAHFAMQAGGWRQAWIAVGVTVLIIGFLPAWTLLVRRPRILACRSMVRPPLPLMAQPLRYSSFPVR